MPKGLKRTNREPQKPKQDKPRPIAAPRSIIRTVDQRAWPASPREEGSDL